MPLNVPLLREIQKRILEEPTAFFMHAWIARRGFSIDWYPDDRGSRVSFPSCGTVGCIAGTACLIMEQRGVIPKLSVSDGDKIREEARKLLGLDSSEIGLFYLGDWDKQIGEEYMAAKTAECRAVAASKQIDLLIEKHKGEKPCH